MHTVVVLHLGEVGVLGLVVGSRLGELGGGGLGPILANNDGDRSQPRLAVRELQQVKVVGGHH